MRMLAPLLLAAVAPSAMAVMNFSAQFTNLRYEITDLRPNDDVAPYQTLVGLGWGGTIVNLNNRHDGKFLDMDFGSQKASLASPAGSAYAEVTWKPDHFALYTRGTALGRQTTVEVSSWAWLQSILGPYTAVTVTADYSFNLHADLDPNASYKETLHMDIDASGLDTHWYDAEVFANPALGRTDFQYTGTARYVFENDGQSTLAIQNYIYTHTQIRPYTAPIPEPATNALMVAGLVFLGGVVSRKNRIIALRSS